VIKEANIYPSMPVLQKKNIVKIFTLREIPFYKIKPFLLDPFCWFDHELLTLQMEKEIK